MALLSVSRDGEESGENPVMLMTQVRMSEMNGLHVMMREGVQGSGLKQESIPWRCGIFRKTRVVVNACIHPIGRENERCQRMERMQETIPLSGVQILCNDMGERLCVEEVEKRDEKWK